VTGSPVLVTGAAGFIGSTLVDRLLADGRDVVGLDNFERFYAREAKERNLEVAKASDRFRFAEVDTRDRDELARLLRETRPAVIIDLAARAGVRDSLRNPWLYIDINVNGLQNLLTCAAEVGATVVFASSSSVYGNNTPAPFREDAGNLRPVSPYGATKVAGEALVDAHRAITGLPARVARLFTVYGPRQRPDLAVHKFAAALLGGAPIPLYANGSGTRDYTFVDDIVDGLVRLADSHGPDLTVNLGSGRPYSTAELVRRLEETFDRRTTIEPLPKQPGDVDATFADISRARAELGWEPRTPFSDGLARFRDWILAEVARRPDQAPTRS
jgi:UDP-glucuronate 4-epimerase